MQENLNLIWLNGSQASTTRRYFTSPNENKVIDKCVAAEHHKQSSVPNKLRFVSRHRFPIQPRLMATVDLSGGMGLVAIVCRTSK